MKLHANHRTCPSTRRLICRRVLEEGWTLAQAARGSRLQRAHGGEVARALPRRRPGAPRSLVAPAAKPAAGCRRARAGAIEALRRLRMTAAEIAEILWICRSRPVSLWLKRIGLGKRSRLEPPEPPNRYERRHPGELVHVDIKQLGRISARARVTACSATVQASRSTRATRRRRAESTGLEYVHVMVDDHSRLAYAEVLEDLTARCAVAFLSRAVAGSPSAASTCAR